MDQTTRVIEVVGVRLQPWEMDGKKGISAELHRRVPLGTRRPVDGAVLKGFATVVEKLDPELLKRIAHLPVPFHCELTEEEYTNGKNTMQVIVGVRPVSVEPVPARQATAKPAAA